jgi:glutamate formiminotransferase/formiminotetrahydrofolate cyclodeaminase
MERVGTMAQRLKDEFLADVDRDTDAFNRVMDAMRLPKKSDEEKKAREEAVQAATKEATMVPMQVLRRTKEAAALARGVAEKGNRNSVSDAGVAALAARTAAEGAWLNVTINLPGIADEKFCEELASEAAGVRAEVIAHAEKTMRIVEKVLEEEAKK